MGYRSEVALTLRKEDMIDLFDKAKEAGGISTNSLSARSSLNTQGRAHLFTGIG